MKKRSLSKQNKLRLLIISSLLLLLLGSCNNVKELNIQDAWSRPALSGNNTAAYFTINNPLTENDRLLSASSTIAEFTEVHLSVMQDGKMMMQQQEFVEIPAQSSIEFKPKDYHIMFINLYKDLNVGDEYQLILQFEKAGAITITVPVKEQE
jgi:copper(I)-binding protein